MCDTHGKINFTRWFGWDYFVLKANLYPRSDLATKTSILLWVLSKCNLALDVCASSINHCNYQQTAHMTLSLHRYFWTFSCIVIFRYGVYSPSLIVFCVIITCTLYFSPSFWVCFVLTPWCLILLSGLLNPSS